MPRPALEIADVFRRYGAAFQEQYGRLLTPLHLLVLKAVALCRTAQLGTQAIRIARPVQRLLSGGLDLNGRAAACSMLPLQISRCRLRKES